MGGRIRVPSVSRRAALFGTLGTPPTLSACASGAGPQVNTPFKCAEFIRRAFLDDPQATLGAAAEWGLALSPLEIRALLATESSLWERVADQLDGRLQRVSLSGRVSS